jgi:23S rRNA A1618 N6-methylase RlmF
MNNNAETDHSILNKIPRAKEEFDKLMADPEIKAQHEACVAAHRKRIEELKERPDYMEMYETLKSERMIKLSRLHKHFGSAIFLEGPEAVPIDLPLLDEVEI